MLDDSNLGNKSTFFEKIMNIKEVRSFSRLFKKKSNLNF